MSGSLVVVGLGPGDPQLLTPAAQATLSQAQDLVGYETYLERYPVTVGQVRHASGNRVEIDRARQALELAASGRRVAVLSGGDPGVFAMAAAVFEAIENGPKTWCSLDVRIEPGVTAMLAAAAEVGAPLGGDFCAISLSTNLKSWSTIAKRLQAAASADFVMALYNPVSKARPDDLDHAFQLLRDIRHADTPVVMVRAAGTSEARVIETTLQEAKGSDADMRTLVIIGSSGTRRVERPGQPAWIYTLRKEVDEVSA